MSNSNLDMIYRDLSMIKPMRKINKIIEFNMSIYKKNQARPIVSLQSPYKKRLKQIAQLANYEPVASIPALNNDFNFTYAKEGHLKRKLKSNNKQTEQSVEKYDRQSPSGTRLPKIESKANKIEYHPTNASEHQHLLTLDTRLDTQQMQGYSGVRSQVQSPLQNRNKNAAIKRIARIWLNARQKYVREEDGDDDEAEQQYADDATPGPGYYSVCDTTSIFNTSKRKNLTDFSFGSRASRFAEKKLDPIQISQKGENNENNPQSENQHEREKFVARRKKLVPFLSCSQKRQSLQMEKIPGPQHYFPRQGIEQELIRKIQRNFKGNFGICEQRFKSDDRYANLGPGSYSPSQDNRYNENAYSHFFKSEKKRFS